MRSSRKQPPIAWVPDGSSGLEITRLKAVATIHGTPVTLHAMRVRPSDAVTGVGPFRPYDATAHMDDLRAAAIPDYPGAWLMWLDTTTTPEQQADIDRRHAEPKDLPIPDWMPDPTVLNRDDDWAHYTPPMPDGTSRLPGADRVYREGWLCGYEGRGVQSCRYVSGRRGGTSYRGVWLEGHKAGAVVRRERRAAQ